MVASSAMPPRAALVVVAVTAACATAPPRPRLGVGVVVTGTAVARDRTLAAAATVDLDGLALAPVALPVAPSAPPPSSSVLAVATARAAYLERGDFETCTAALREVEVPELLAAGARELAARVLVWRTACAFGRLAPAEAADHAAALAGFGLALPDDAGAVTPDVEAILVAALDRAGAAARLTVEVDGRAGARLTIDGRPAECALPCTVALAPGDHVVAVTADGAAPAWRVIRVPVAGPVTIPQAPAAPALALAQWRARAGRGLPLDDAAGLALLAQGAGVRRLLYLGAGERLRGALVVDGLVKARGARAPGEVAALVHDLTTRGGLVPAPPLWRRPRFWGALGVAAAAAAAITAAIVLEPDVRTEVGFRW